jgi:hypothetical protein
MSLNVYFVNLGSMFDTQVRHRYPHLVSRSLWVDPVCFLIHQPVVATVRSISLYDLLTRRAGAVGWAQKLLMSLSFVVVFRDMFTQFIMKRTFFVEHSFLGDLGARDTVVLAECDAITPAQPIYAYASELGTARLSPTFSINCHIVSFIV